MLPSFGSENRITALLGPTNTGKTHRAVERMLEHESGMIGLPLRLLAREVYDRVAKTAGEQHVALVTGEEKRVPPRPSYWICTVEAMPVTREVDFLAVDEVQLATHAERGHVFTSRLLGARGRRETWFLGSHTMTPIVRQLVPTASIESHPRLSSLSGVGQLSLSQLPPRTAVVAFSAPRVYELAERIRARRGGAAVVLGALSPRARNAQVALYESGEVDYMVATDAIGMGLNLDVRSIAFADLRKFDGRTARELTEPELAQIAGRAGRYQTDGTFATLAPLGPLPASVARAIEQHRFPFDRRVFWRNDDLDFTSPADLLASLSVRPKVNCLVPIDRAVDHETLVQLAVKPEVVRRTRTREGVKLLWEVARIPDYRQLLLDDHAGLLTEIFLQVSGPSGRIDADWMAARIAQLEDVQGDLETLLARMAFIRTWTYISQHDAWVDGAEGWQERTRRIEDRLSDALHELLVRRFVDRGRARTRSVPSGSEKASRKDRPKHGLSDLGLLFEKRPEPANVRPATYALELAQAPDERFRVDAVGRIWDKDTQVGALTRGADLLLPEASVVLPESEGAAQKALEKRLLALARGLVAQALGPLREEAAPLETPPTRGIVYLLERSLGTLRVDEARAELGHLTAEDRQALERRGVCLGLHVVFVPSLLKPAALVRRLALCRAYAGAARAPNPPDPRVVSFRSKPEVEPRLYSAVGFPVFGGRAIRADVAERVAARLAECSSSSDSARRIGTWIGCPRREAPRVMRALLGGRDPEQPSLGAAAEAARGTSAGP